MHGPASRARFDTPAGKDIKDTRFAYRPTIGASKARAEPRRMPAYIRRTNPSADAHAQNNPFGAVTTATLATQVADHIGGSARVYLVDLSRCQRSAAMGVHGAITTEF
jgi:hypothetical protein